MSGRGIWNIGLAACLVGMLAAAHSAVASDVATSTNASRLLDRAGFGADFAMVANQMHPQMHFLFVPKDFSVTFDGAGREPRTIFLDNAYLAYRSHPADEQAIITHYVSAMTDAKAFSGKVADTDRVALLPVIKDARWVSGVNQMMAHAKKPDQLVTMPLADGLYEVYVIDDAQAMVFVNTSTLAELGMTPDQVQDQAARNLALLLPNVRIDNDRGLYRVHLDTNYETSLPLVFARWKARLGLRHDPAIALPARGELLIADSTDAASVLRLRSIAQQDSQQSSYPVTPQLYVLHGDSWSVLH
jgi:hypothetical protein